MTDLKLWPRCVIVILCLFQPTIAQIPDLVEVEMAEATFDSSRFSFVDFKETGALGNKPLRAYSGVPTNFEATLYGYFQMSVKEHIRDRYVKYGRNWYLLNLGSDYPIDEKADSKVDFLIGTLAGNEGVLIDTDNDEVFSDETFLKWERRSSDHPFFEIRSDVEFEFWDRGKLTPDNVQISLLKFPNYKNVQNQTAYKGLMLEYRRGELSIGDERVTIALTPQHEFATYDALDFLVLYLDLDNDADFRPWESIRPMNGPFTLHGATLELVYCSPQGKTLLFKKHEDPQKAVDLSAISSQGDSVPDLTMEMFDGSTMQLSQLGGKVILLDFWGIWCGPCLQAISVIADLYERYHHKGFEVLGVLREEDKELQASYERLFEAKKMTWPQVYSDELIRHFNVVGVPDYVLMSDQQTVIARDHHLLRDRLPAVLESLVGS